MNSSLNTLVNRLERVIQQNVTEDTSGFIHTTSLSSGVKMNKALMAYLKVAQRASISNAWRV